ncbi:hypothetical protein [Streptomyces sp. NPDC051561]|uniref:hypothetical protein n=1 Tax=Streptomyces sp. NPDC051561 TaxID=3365658 RepID=UPI00378E11A8
MHMHPETFRHVHAARSAELQRQAAAHDRARALTRQDASHRTAHRPYRALRTQLGWKLVELGLRLVRTAGSGTGSGEHRFRTAGAR